jgi:hypothetical protein
MDLALALSAPGWTAVGALGGALIGVVAGGVVESALDWRRDRKLAKVGARLVGSDLADADTKLHEMQTLGKVLGYRSFPMSNWNEYRSALAAGLDSEAFEAVSRSIVQIKDFSTNRDEVLKGDRAADVPPDAFNSMRDNAAKAYNALAGLAGHERVGSRIQPS